MARNKPPPQPAHKPTSASRAVVKALYGAGVDQEYICQQIGVSPVTLRKYYDAELNSGVMTLGVEAIKRLARDMKSSKSGMAGTTAAIWVTKNTRGLGWADKQERTGDGGTQVHIGAGAKVIVLPSNGREQLAQMRLAQRQASLPAPAEQITYAGEEED